jgi:DNA-binding response OmpR family regulator
VARVLIVEDSPDIAELIKHYLERAGYDTTVHASGRDALIAARQSPPDLAVLDIMLPGMDGLQVCQALRSEPSTAAVPILMLTAKGEEADRVKGLELGADDYVTKPFSPRELVARVRAVLRRHAPGAQAEVIEAGDLSLDVPRMRVTRSGEPIDLTATEFALLATMARQPGRVFTRSQLLDAIHGVAFESYERAIDAHIKNIRRKLEPDPRAPTHLLTVYGVGYRLAD